MKMALQKFISQVTKAATWKTLWTSIVGVLTFRNKAFLPVPSDPTRINYGTLTTLDGSYLRYAHYYRATHDHKGTVLVLSGRREFIEEYDEVNRDFLARGYQVYSFDWRGQGASKRCLEDGEKGHIDDYKTYLKDLEFFIEAFMKTESDAPFYIFGHSMGGHILLRYLLEHHPKQVKGVILSAPMVDIRTGNYPYRVARGIARAMILSGKHEKYIFGEEGNLLDEDAFEGNPFTHDAKRYKKRIRLQNTYKDYVVTGYTFGWLEATFRSIKALREKMKTERHDFPMLILSPEKDPVVNSESFVRILDCFQNAKMTIYPDTGHCLMDERDDVRTQIWQDIDNFFKNTTPSDPEELTK